MLEEVRVSARCEYDNNCYLKSIKMSPVMEKQHEIEQKSLLDQWEQLLNFKFLIKLMGATQK